jgi:hypothetical protein
MILDDEDILIREASNSCQDPIKMLFDHYDDESSSLNLLNRYMNFERFKWKQSGSYYILVDNKDLIHCQIFKDPHGSGIMNITIYPYNEECENRLHNIFTTLDMFYFKICDVNPSKRHYVRYELHDMFYNPSIFNRVKRIIV